MLSKSKSLSLTGILVKVAFVSLVAALFCIPICVEWYETVSHTGGSTGIQAVSVYIPLMLVCYLSVGAAFPLVIALDRLISNIRKGEVFIAANVKILHIMSYCCFAISLFWAVMTAFRFLSVVVFVAAAFFGLILRVIKSVFEEAVYLREENDATI